MELCATSIFEKKWIKTYYHIRFNKGDDCQSKPFWARHQGWRRLNGWNGWRGVNLTPPTPPPRRGFLKNSTKKHSDGHWMINPSTSKTANNKVLMQQKSILKRNRTKSTNSHQPRFQYKVIFLLQIKPKIFVWLCIKVVNTCKIKY